MTNKLDQHSLNEFCDTCNDFMPTTIVHSEETYKVRGKEISILASVRICTTCKTSIFDEDLDSVNLEKAYDLFRQEENYLSAKEIVAIRQSYRLSQRGFAALLGWGPATVARYESGSIPSKSHHTSLRQAKDDPTYLRDLYARNQHALGRLDQQRFESTRQKPYIDDEKDTIELLTKKYSPVAVNQEYTGYTDFNFNKLSTIILYMTSHIPKVSKTKLMKLLFYSDFKSYQKYGLSITGIAYQHFPYGPVPYHHLLMLDALTENHVVHLQPFDNFEGEFIEPNQQYDLSLLDKEEIETIQEVIDHFHSFNASTISDYSHEEDAYKQTRNGEFIPYEYGETMREFGEDGK
ncbi:DUF4065 domain-containing protein [Paenalkalicoccus suaedae]|uniref:DUF4065 domain-containing protein n=1 Tax=Paenalkalicoccus suaedae TaxID=2592382 RepID=A0A859FJ66_9BACI|nr:type II TA system antitoxin MqsA family protein [Paenalkalicoccus suaedae]QKS72556.1 DUF4065 domain-containing protein [Paenalkalicoccus suaedae]